jgi:hypothetical protein
MVAHQVVVVVLLGGVGGGGREGERRKGDLSQSSGYSAPAVCLCNTASVVCSGGCKEHATVQ